MIEHPAYNAAAYIRLSREDGDRAESDSIVNQRRLICDYLETKEEFALFETYVDDGFTGTNFNRPAFIKMIEDIEAGRVNCVVVKDLSRFGRDYIDTGKYLERFFPDRNVRFISITDGIDSARQAYDMLLPIKNIFNEQYARDISEKVHAAMRTKQKAGEFIGAFASYGYCKSPTDKNRLIIDGYAAGVVRRIFALYGKGMGKNAIAALLNKEGIVCPSEYKKLNGENYRNGHRLESTSYWTYSTIHRILSNEIYRGSMVQGKKTQRMRGKQRSAAKEDWIVVRGTHEAVIDEATWERTQNLLRRRTRASGLNADRTILAGYLRCADCGRAMVKKSKAGQNGTGEIRFLCGTYVRSGRQFCTPHAVSLSVLDEIILGDLNTMLKNLNDLNETVKKIFSSEDAGADRLNSERDKLCAEIEKIRIHRRKAYGDYLDEVISKEEYIDFSRTFQKKEDNLKKMLEELDAGRRIRKDGASAQPWIKHLLDAEKVEELDRYIVAEMVQEIKVYENNKLEITYRFSDELMNGKMSL